MNRNDFTKIKPVLIGNILILVVLIVIVTIALYFAFVRPSQDLPNEIQPVAKQEIVDTSDWKTYRAEEFGFEVRYPNNLLVVAPYIGPDPTGYDFAVQISNVEVPFGIWCGEEEIEFEINPCASNQAVYVFVRDLELRGETLQEVISFSTSRSDMQELVTINGLNFIKVGKNFPMYFVEKQSVAYFFSWVAGEAVIDNSREIYNQIISTFRFIE